MERQFDVIVVGGGTAGFAAAVTAARGGAKTLLIEEKAYLGGTATGAQVSMFMGFADGEPDRPQQGIIKDVMDGLAAAGGTPGIETIYLCGRRDLDIPVIPYESEILKDLIFDLVDQAGVELLLHTRVIGAQVEDGVITRFAAAFGAVADTVLRYRDLESMLIGKTVAEAKTAKADVLRAYSEKLVLTRGRVSAEYRKTVCMNLLGDFLTEKGV